MNRRDLEAGLEELHPASFGWAFFCCAGDHAEAEDVLQEAYLMVLGGQARFNGASSLKTWLFGVIRRTAAGRRRRRWLRALSLSRWMERRAPEPEPRGPESRLDDQRRHDALERALGALPRRQREILHLVFYQELTVEESAGVLGISCGSARTHYHRGKANLREWLGGTNGS